MLNIPKTKNGLLYLPPDHDLSSTAKMLVDRCDVPWWIAMGSLDYVQEKGTFTEDELVTELAERMETQELIDQLLTSGKIERILGEDFEWHYCVRE